ncbi:fluoride efflux transporter CrcB [bacterium]|nr:fluoride efflux transporter CrcB [bacterium]
MPAWIYIIGGGGLGALSRYLIGGWINKRWTDVAIPLGTLGVNIIGCLVIGLLAGFMDGRYESDSPARHFLLIGLMGGFTTYSSFGLETLHLMRDAHMGSALAHMGLHMTLGLLAVCAGWYVSQQLKLT